MRIDFASLAFGYTVLTGGNTPNWATALGQGKDHKINVSSEIDDILRGMTYKAVSSEKISTKIGKGGNVVHGSSPDSPILSGAVFEDVYINDTPIIGGKFILIITRDTSKSHAGRLRLKYGPANTYNDSGEIYSNEMFYSKVREQLKMADDACWFVSDISIVEQSKVILKTTIVNALASVDYSDRDALHSAWEKLDSTLLGISDFDIAKGGVNELYYGVPGAGKSFMVDERINGATFERVVFHPDYTYSDFVGQIMPRIKQYGDSEKLSYEFTPGPFTKALQSAESDTASMTYLVIEELNRGNAPAIFGDIFQLLDRGPNGEGKYSITNFDIAKAVYGDEGHEIRIPSNLSILATMNTSDQNVFTLDTAFQRRWNMKYVENKIHEAEHAQNTIGSSNVTWEQFASVVNEELLNYTAELGNSEDKQLGAYFVRPDELTDSVFSEKALKYLWDDAFKMDHDIIFSTNIKSIGDIILEHKRGSGDPLKRILNSEIYKRMIQYNATSDISNSETNLEEI